MTEFSASRGGDPAATEDCTRRGPARPSRRLSYPDLGPTGKVGSRVVRRDASESRGDDARPAPYGWPAWTDARVESIDLDGFDGRGNPLPRWGA